jgi:hypothetical protein
MSRKFAPALLMFAAALTMPAAASAQGTIRIERRDCARLIAHRPDADVAFRPGVDVRGNAVAPAELDGGSRPELPDSIPILITIDLQERFGIPADSRLFEPNAYIGIAAFRFADGAITFNGQPLTDPEQAALAAACAETR